MKVGILGSGDVALTLGDGFLKHGHQVVLGTSTPARLAEWSQGKPKDCVSTFAGAAQFGWETADMGAAEAARAIEPLCMLWCIPGFRNNNWAHAFKLLTRKGV